MAPGKTPPEYTRLPREEGRGHPSLLEEPPCPGEGLRHLPGEEPHPLLLGQEVPGEAVEKDPKPGRVKRPKPRGQEGGDGP